MGLEKFPAKITIKRWSTLSGDETRKQCRHRDEARHSKFKNFKTVSVASKMVVSDSNTSMCFWQRETR